MQHPAPGIPSPALTMGMEVSLIIISRKVQRVCFLNEKDGMTFSNTDRLRVMSCHFRIEIIVGYRVSCMLGHCQAAPCDAFCKGSQLTRASEQ